MAEKATTTGYGHTILNPTVTSASNGEAATAGAVKAANDNANTRILKSAIGQPGGVPKLDENGKVLNADGSIAGSGVIIADIDFATAPTASLVVLLEGYKKIYVQIRAKHNHTSSANIELDAKLKGGVNKLGLTTVSMSGSTVASGGGIARTTTHAKDTFWEVEAELSIKDGRIAATSINNGTQYPSLRSSTTPNTSNELVDGIILSVAQGLLYEGTILVWGFPE